MTKQENCQGCNQKNDCQKVYERMGNAKGPSVVWKVVVAFLLPIAIFITALAIFEEILAGVVNDRQARTAISFLLAVLAALVFVVIAKMINAKLRKNENADR